MSSRILFHGTHKDHINSFKRNGLKANDSYSSGSRGKAFLTPRPDVAFAYAVMGGEGQYLSSKGRPKDVPDSDRALIVFNIPEDWYQKHMVREVGGHVPEVSFDIGIPSKFIKTVVVGDRKKVYAYMPKENFNMKSFKSFITEISDDLVNRYYKKSGEQIKSKSDKMMSNLRSTEADAFKLKSLLPNSNYNKKKKENEKLKAQINKRSAANIKFINRNDKKQ